MPITSKSKWDGMSVMERFERATARAAVSIGMHVAVETKRVTHVVEGTLRRSVHAAPAGYDGAGDELVAQATDMHNMASPPQATITPTEALVEVGSWLPYACVEWIGRGHPGITQGMEMTRGVTCDRIVRAALRQEGLA